MEGKKRDERVGRVSVYTEGTEGRALLGMGPAPVEEKGFSRTVGAKLPHPAPLQAPGEAPIGAVGSC